MEQGQRVPAVTNTTRRLTGQVELVNLLVILLDELLLKLGVVLGRVAASSVPAPDLGVGLLFLVLFVLVLVLGEERGHARPTLLLALCATDNARVSSSSSTSLV